MRKHPSGDYHRLRMKILGRSALILLGALAFMVLIYDLFIYQRFANQAVGFLTWLLGDKIQARRLYQHLIRNYLEVYFLGSVGLVFLAVLWFYLRSFIRYFYEINDGIYAILNQEGEVKLSPELQETERNINAIRQELAQRQEASHQAEQRKNDLVMYLAHDIRTPLTSVIGYLNLLEEAPDMPKAQREKYTHITLEKAYSLEKMINEFFEITRYNIHQIVLEKTSIDLYMMLTQLADEMTPLLSANDNRIDIQASEDLTVYADPDKLARVFRNILKNASVYSDPHSVITICAMATDSQVCIAIKNQGQTIAREKLDAIFARFYRMDDARSTRTGGSGLGLAIAREIITQHGGTIGAESWDNQVVFSITLPQPVETENVGA